MNYLKMTNLTDTPLEDMHAKIDEAIKWIEEQDKIVLEVGAKSKIYKSFDNILYDFEENGKISEALGFIDNMIVNFDYIEFVKECLNN